MFPTKAANVPDDAELSLIPNRMLSSFSRMKVADASVVVPKCQYLLHLGFVPNGKSAWNVVNDPDPFSVMSGVRPTWNLVPLLVLVSGDLYAEDPVIPNVSTTFMLDDVLNVEIGLISRLWVPVLGVSTICQ